MKWHDHFESTIYFYKHYFICANLAKSAECKRFFLRNSLEPFYSSRSYIGKIKLNVKCFLATILQKLLLRKISGTIEQEITFKNDNTHYSMISISKITRNLVSSLHANSTGRDSSRVCKSATKIMCRVTWSSQVLGIKSNWLATISIAVLSAPLI